MMISVLTDDDFRVCIHILFIHSINFMYLFYLLFHLFMLYTVLPIYQTWIY